MLCLVEPAMLTAQRALCCRAHEPGTWQLFGKSLPAWLVRIQRTRLRWLQRRRAKVQHRHLASRGKKCLWEDVEQVEEVEEKHIDRVSVEIEQQSTGALHIASSSTSSSALWCIALVFLVII